jgi:hypothetical protein
MLRPRLLLLGICLACVAASDARAQGEPPAPPDRRFWPGDKSLRSAGIRSDTVIYALTGYRDSDEIPVGTITDIVTRTGADRPVIRRVLSVQRGTAMLIDSTVTDAVTLAPREHRSIQPQRMMQIEFEGKRVRGRIGPIESPGAAIDTTLSWPVFDSGNWDLVVRSMPLAENFAAIFRVYDLDSGMRDYRVRVLGSTPMHGENAHIVLFQLGGQREATVWIGDTTRRLLQVETPLGPTTILRQTLRTP